MIREFEAVEIVGDRPVLVKKSLKDQPSVKDQIIIKLIVSGVCRSDLKEIGQTRTVRRDFGHEFVGEIVLCPEGLKKLNLGDWVVYDPHIKLRFRSSGFAEYLKARDDLGKLEKAFLKVNKDVAVERLVFIEPLACALHCVENLFKYLGRRNLNELRVAIIGAGNAGTLIGLLIKYFGGEVTFLNRGIKRVNFMRKKRLFPRKAYNRISEGQEDYFDIVIPTTSFIFSEVLKRCLELVKNDGLILLFGGTKKNIKYEFIKYDIDRIRRKEQLVDLVYCGKKLKIGGTHGALTRDFLKSIDFISLRLKEFPVEKLISQRIKLKDLPRKLTDLLRTQYYGKTLVLYSPVK